MCYDCIVKNWRNVALRAETFLSRFRVLEGLLNRKYEGSLPASQSVVMKYIGDAESAPVRQQLNVCREIRNLLTHNADSDGQPLVEPSQAALDSLEEIIRYVQTPQKALSYATPKERILTAHPNDRALEIMRRMDKSGFSHVPVAQEGRLVGVFSVSTVFSHLLAGKKVLEDTRVKEFGPLLALEGRPSGRFLVLDADAAYQQVRAEFEKHSDRNQRLSLVFLTSTGDLSGELLGILSPWDVIGETP